MLTSFYQIYRSGKMPITGAKPNRDYITVKVKFGS